MLQLKQMLCWLVVAVGLMKLASSQTCEFPANVQGQWLYVGLEVGRIVHLDVTMTRISRGDGSSETGEVTTMEPVGSCFQQDLDYGQSAEGKLLHKAMVVTRSDIPSGDIINNPVYCYHCFIFYVSTPNVLQMQQIPQCLPMAANDPKLADPFSVCQHANSTKATLFKKDPVQVNCKATFEGVFQFQYEQAEQGGGFCNNPESEIRACQEPGSKYVDNEVFYMTFKPCKGVGSSMDLRFQFQCLGMWFDERENLYAGVYDLGAAQDFNRFRCLMTRRDQTQLKNIKYWVMSDTPSCNLLKSIYDGPIRLMIQPQNKLREQALVPQCKLPLNYTGQWFTSEEYDSDVVINQTHIVFYTKMSQFYTRITIYTCQQSWESRFLMTAVTEGWCEVDYVCFDFLPRETNIIRYRTSKSYWMREEDISAGQIEADSSIFRRSCVWMSFMMDYGQREWKYSTLILNPPTAVQCPIAGRYTMKQYGSRANFFVHRIRGITPQPRLWVDCRENSSVMYSCVDAKVISVDAEYCDTLDPIGKPIDEYIMPDYDLVCVGYWMEDNKSYMVTYEKEDPISPFRCWVYQRLNWLTLRMSRAIRSKCGSLQTIYSTEASEGASLSIELYDAERVHDECPERYDDGRPDRIRIDVPRIITDAAPLPLPGLGLLFAALLALFALSLLHC